MLLRNAVWIRGQHRSIPKHALQCYRPELSSWRRNLKLSRRTVHGTYGHTCPPQGDTSSTRHGWLSSNPYPTGAVGTPAWYILLPCSSFLVSAAFVPASHWDTKAGRARWKTGLRPGIPVCSAAGASGYGMACQKNLSGVPGPNACKIIAFL